MRSAASSREQHGADPDWGSLHGDLGHGNDADARPLDGPGERMHRRPLGLAHLEPYSPRSACPSSASFSMPLRVAALWNAPVSSAYR